MADPYAARIAAEHRELLRTVHRIRGDLARLHELGDPLGARLTELLQELAGRLRSHFALEELEGPMAGRGSGDPAREHRIGVLIREHREVEEGLERVLFALDALDAPDTQDPPRERGEAR
jgi:iron-sulfur cluster repair protein YtfE (RIC family)